MHDSREPLSTGVMQIVADLLHEPRRRMSWDPLLLALVPSSQIDDGRDEPTDLSRMQWDDAGHLRRSGDELAGDALRDLNELPRALVHARHFHERGDDLLRDLMLVCRDVHFGAF